MTFKQICSVENNQIVIVLPPSFGSKKQVTVVIDDQVDAKIQKMQLIKEASMDPLFLADVAEVQKDFGQIDNEIA